jgi:hypothetical protein
MPDQDPEVQTEVRETSDAPNTEAPSSEAPARPKIQDILIARWEFIESQLVAFRIGLHNANDDLKKCPDVPSFSAQQQSMLASFLSSVHELTRVAVGLKPAEIIEQEQAAQRSPQIEVIRPGIILPGQGR